MKNSYIICYDISNPKVWRKVYRYLQKQGLRLQWSIFYVLANKVEIEKHKNILFKFIDKGDDLRIYPITTNTIYWYGAPAIMDGLLLSGSPNFSVMGDR
jgi:CRISPR-associated protein Cas2